MAFAEGRAGDVVLNDGSPREIRLSRAGALVTTDGHGRYYEAVRRGHVFGASMQAGASLGTALTATAVTLTLYNPSGSGVALSLLKCSVAITTFTAGTTSMLIVYAVNNVISAAIPTSTTAATVRGALLGAAAGLGQAFTAATLPAAPVIWRPHPASLYLDLAAGDTLGGATDEVAGEIVLLPNTAVTIQNIGGTVSGVVAMVWEEIPL